MSHPVNAELSAKRRAAGILGAAARWGNGTSNGKNAKPVPSANGKPQPGAWYRIENLADAGTADIYIYDEISYWGVSAQDFVNELNTITASTLNVYINSPGGDVFDGIAILNALRRSEATVNVVVDGVAASAASFIAVGAGDTVTMSRNSQMMIHDALGIEIGNAEEMRAFADRLDQASQNIASIYAEAAGPRGGSTNIDDWRALMKAETWMTAQEAVDLGLADQVDGTEPDSAPAPDAIAPKNAARLDMAARFKHRGREDAPAPSRPAAQLEPPAPTVPTAPAPVYQFDPDLFRKAVKEAAL